MKLLKSSPLRFVFWFAVFIECVTFFVRGHDPWQRDASANAFGKKIIPSIQLRIKAGMAIILCTGKQKDAITENSGGSDLGMRRGKLGACSCPPNQKGI